MSRMCPKEDLVIYEAGKVKLAFDCGELGTRVMISFALLRFVKETDRELLLLVLWWLLAAVTPVV